MRAIRLHQWAKNTLIFLPLLLAHVRAVGPVVAAFLAFLSFGLAASATYIFNDLLDLEADRHHPRKRSRPFAAGDLSPITGAATILLFLALSLALALLLPRVLTALSPQFPWNGQGSFIEWLVLYAISTTVYSLRLKRMVLVDVMVLACLYTIRILAGSAASGVMVSPWLAAFSIFFFLSLAFVKRFSELESMSLRSEPSGALAVKGRGYRVSDLEQLRSFGTASGYASVVVFALYIGTVVAQGLYSHYTRLWLLVPVLLLWLSRLWLRPPAASWRRTPSSTPSQTGAASSSAWSSLPSSSPRCDGWDKLKGYRMKTRDILRLILDEGWVQVANAAAIASSSIRRGLEKSPLPDIHPRRWTKGPAKASSNRQESNHERIRRRLRENVYRLERLRTRPSRPRCRRADLRCHRKAHPRRHRVPH